LGLTVNDSANHYDGSLATMDCVTVPVPDLGHHVVQAVEVEIAVAHPYVGDLIMKVVSPNTTAVLTVFNRPGVAEASDDYNESPNGDDSDLVTGYPIRFRDGAPASAEDMGKDIGGSAVVCRDDTRCDCHPSPGTGPGTAFADFRGLEAVGDWRVCFADGDDIDEGTVDRVTLSVLAW
ncbi:MAG: hypothetical protein HY908_36660, partial [Myxococcales bacterium]|nr:hypothetical protein [Myxococcales bacterium]